MRITGKEEKEEGAQMQKSSYPLALSTRAYLVKTGNYCVPHIPPIYLYDVLAQASGCGSAVRWRLRSSASRQLLVRDP